MSKNRSLAISLFLAVMLAGSISLAAQFPAKPVQIICPYSAGGSTDLFGRIAARHAAKYLGQSIVVVNRTGGGGAVGVSYVANADPDGYTLLNTVLTHMFMYKTVPGVRFTPKDFRGVSQLADDQLFFGVKRGARADLAVDKLVKLAKEKPNEIVCGIGSNWGAFDLARIKFEQAAGIKFRRVTFKGGTGTTKALLSRFCDLMPIFAGELGPHVEAGTARWLAVANEERVSEWPNTPTFREYGYDVIWHQPRFFMAPAGTPDKVVKILDEAFKKAFNDPAWKEEMKKSGYPVQTYRGAANLDEFLEKTLKGLEKPLEIMVEERKKATK